MGLKSTIQQTVLGAMNALDDIPTEVVYHSTGAITYDPATRTPSETGGSDYTIEKAILVGYKSSEIDGVKILKTDQQLLIPGLSLTVTPKENDYVTVDGIKWDIEDFSIDPADAMWIFQVRKASG
jgi:hypothetical protein